MNQIQAALDFDARPRRVELVDARLIRDSGISARTQGGGGLGTAFELGGGLVTHALRGEGFDASEDGTGRGTPLVAATLNAAMGKGKNGQDVGALVPAIVGQAMSSKWAKGTAGPAGDEARHRVQAVATQWAVRRLTPLEAERLMGFPEGHTAIPHKGKPASECPDGPRYKSLGNSWAVPVARWIGERIEAVDAIAAERMVA